MRHNRAKSTFGLTLAFSALLAVHPAHADTGLSASPARGLQEALASRDHAMLYDGSRQGGLGGGLSLNGNFFSGRASGSGPVTTGFYNDATNGQAFDASHPAELEGEQRVYALLVDGTYDFNTDFGSGLPLHPYINGGLGMAMYGSATGSTLGMQSGEMVPLFRVGGGVSYALGEKWNLSVDYKAGFTGAGFSGASPVIGGQQPADMQMVNMGMHFSF